jgi:hypothetical protein
MRGEIFLHPVQPRRTFDVGPGSFDGRPYEPSVSNACLPLAQLRKVTSQVPYARNSVRDHHRKVATAPIGEVRVAVPESRNQVLTGSLHDKSAPGGTSRRSWPYFCNFDPLDDHRPVGEDRSALKIHHVDIHEVRQLAGLRERSRHAPA